MKAKAAISIKLKAAKKSRKHRQLAKETIKENLESWRHRSENSILRQLKIAWPGGSGNK
jgi:hypothetical protein